MELQTLSGFEKFGQTTCRAQLLLDMDRLKRIAVDSKSKLIHRRGDRHTKAPAHQFTDGKTAETASTTQLTLKRSGSRGGVALLALAGAGLTVAGPRRRRSVCCISWSS
jgi:hypothetical protein